MATYNPNNPWFGIPTKYSKDLKNVEEAKQWWRKQGANVDITPTLTSPSGASFDAQGNLILPNGQKISPQDPSYNDLVKHYNLTAPVIKEGDEEEKGKEDEEEAMTAEEKQQIDKLNNEIDTMDLSFEQKSILKEIVAGDYVSGAYIPTNEELSKIIQDAATNAEIDLSPYYEKLTTRETEDIKANLAFIRESAARYGQAEAMDYKQKLAATKQNLRLRGITFSGSSIKLLGAESALKETGGIEGELPTARRLGYEGQVASWQEEARKLATPAERRLGSNVFGTIDLGISTPYGGSTIYSPYGTTTTGDIALERAKEIEKSKWERMRSYRPYI